LPCWRRVTPYYALEKLTDANLEAMRLTNWGEQWPAWRIFWAIISDDVHHGAEIGCLRDLYRDKVTVT
jgi:hypothetical protein